MQSSSQSGFTGMSPSGPGVTLHRKRDDVTYQAMTVAAILLVLATMWVF
jgi:hypothetical protein